MLEEKYVCPFCGFESNGPGVCPTCDEVLEKECLCKTGKFSSECCEEEPEEIEKKEKIIKAEIAAESLSELAEQEKKKAGEEAELENVEPIDKDEDEEE
jgi:hypothetical protein